MVQFSQKFWLNKLVENEGQLTFSPFNLQFLQKIKKNNVVFGGHLQNIRSFETDIQK